MAMDEVTFVYALRWICLSIDTLGILVGLDLIIGAPVIRGINAVLNKVIDIDKNLAKTSTRVGAGIIFVVISAAMLYVTLRAR
ncbi:MAG: hypothetical protein PHF11_06825 [Candidatus Omnitrophica bacterium]|nr:hypothetical protein [Candidatus Omnitrophota bacterium]